MLYAPAESTEYQARRRELNEGLARLHHALVVLGQPSIPRQPSKRALYYPAARLHGEAAGSGFALHNFKLPARALLPAPVRQVLATVGCVRPDLLEARHKVRKAAQESARLGNRTGRRG
jgi:hypothetical protein